MNSYPLILACVGCLILLVAWLPMVLRELPLSLPMFCIAVGFVIFWLIGSDAPDPRQFPYLTERLSEMVVIIALTGAGLKLDRPFGWRSWALTWRMLVLAMPLSIIGIGLIAYWLLGLSAAAALLLGAVLAPTDPVLAADVQVGPPRSGQEDEVRFALTAEAGLNDGLAFPFVNLAIALAMVGTAPAAWAWDWFSVDVVWKLGIGLAAGHIVGRLLGWLTFQMPNRARLSRTGDGFVALGTTLLSYGATELVHGYGFIAVFVAALAMRDAERHHQYHDRLHDFAEQTERLLMMVLLVLFGGALAKGLLEPLTWSAVWAALAFIFLVRPAAGLMALLGSGRPPSERGAIAFFGIRGLGSIYYLAFAAKTVTFAELPLLWAIVGLTVLVSVGLHGITVTPAMKWLDNRRSRQGTLQLDE